MNKLLKKELRLTAAPITYFFLAFALMTLIPGYPIFVGGVLHHAGHLLHLPDGKGEQ